MLCACASISALSASLCTLCSLRLSSPSALSRCDSTPCASRSMDRSFRSDSRSRATSSSRFACSRAIANMFRSDGLPESTCDCSSAHAASLRDARTPIGLSATREPRARAEPRLWRPAPVTQLLGVLRRRRRARALRRRQLPFQRVDTARARRRLLAQLVSLATQTRLRPRRCVAPLPRLGFRLSHAAALRLERAARGVRLGAEGDGLPLRVAELALFLLELLAQLRGSARMRQSRASRGRAHAR